MLQTQNDVYIRGLLHTVLSLRQGGAPWTLAGMVSLMFLPEATGRSEANSEPLTHGLSITGAFPWVFLPQCVFTELREEQGI